MQIVKIFLVSVFVSFQSLQAQSIKKEKMRQLDFMVGEWIGTSTIYEDGVVTKQVPAFEKISYDLDSSILVVELKSELLQLHTIIYYNDAEGTYYYHPFSKKGS